ncbi:MAG: hypothetical protein FWF52_08340 [Candidatus Azobacteroides sp.]|nr:hypothetical protein [Candidatus Azobacteroides sp.]
MKQCPQCQKENPSSANYCMYCRTPLVENEELDKIDKLHDELSDAKETIQLLKKALSNEQEKKAIQPAINIPAQAQTIDIQPKRVDQRPERINQQPEKGKQPKREEKSKSFPWAVLIVGIILLLGAGGAIGYYGFYLPYITDRDAPRYYTFATNVFLRSSPVSGVDYNIVGKVPYGSELIVYDYGSEWSEVKWKRQKGFVSSNYILLPFDFSLLNSIWGDNESKEIIDKGRYRLALLYYIKRNGYDNGIWQVFSKSKNSKYNSTYYKKIINSNSKFADFAVILKNTITKERKFLLFSFNDDETPHLEYEEAAPPTGDIYAIKPVYYMSFDADAYSYQIEYR